MLEEERTERLATVSLLLQESSEGRAWPPTCLPCKERIRNESAFVEDRLEELRQQLARDCGATISLRRYLHKHGIAL